MKSYNLLLGLTVTACALSAQEAQPAPVSDINQQSAYTSPDVEALQRMLATRNRALNDMQQQLEELQTEISELRGVTEEQANTINQILQRQRELYQEIDRRLAAVPATPAANTNSNASNSVSYSNNLSENEAYDHAVNLVLKEKRYDQAITEFSAFNNKYPNSSYSANAHYWLGQLLFNKNDLNGAEKEFSIVINNFESSSKRSDAMLTLGMVAQKQNNNAKAKSTYNKLIKEYPGTSAAQLAKSRLSNL